MLFPVVSKMCVWKKRRVPDSLLMLLQNLAGLAYLELVLKGGGQHVGEHLQCYRQQDFHERDHQEDDKRNKPEDISCSSCQLFPFSPVQQHRLGCASGLQDKVSV